MTPMYQRLAFVAYGALIEPVKNRWAASRRRKRAIEAAKRVRMQCMLQPSTGAFTDRHGGRVWWSLKGSPAYYHEVFSTPEGGIDKTKVWVDGKLVLHVESQWCGPTTWGVFVYEPGSWESVVY